MTNFLSKCNTYKGNKPELTSSTSKSRNVTFDIAKGLGIILMVLAHAGGPFIKFIYLFHMPLFFILSGYFFKESCYLNFQEVKTFIKKRLKTLYIPFIACNLVFLILHNFFLDINFYTNNPLFEKGTEGNSFGLKNYYTIPTTTLKTFYTLILATGEQLGGATWFLKVLFFITIFSCLGCFILKKLIRNQKIFEISQAAIYTTLLFSGFILYLKNFNFYAIGTMFSCSAIFYLGILYKKYEFKIKINFPLFLFCFLILLFCHINNTQKFEIGGNYYNTPVWLILASSSGFFFTLYLSKLLEKIKFIQNSLSYIGRHTIAILCLHFLFFKIITYLQVLIYNQPDYMLAAFPALFNQNGWWIAYGIVGIAGPLITLEVYKKLKQNINNKLQSLFH